MGLGKLYLLTLVLLISVSSYAADCRIADKLADPKLANNTGFWSELSQQSDQSDDAIARLIQKHDPDFDYTPAGGSTTRVPTASTSKSFNISKASQKAIQLLTKTQRRNFDEFVSTVGKEGGLKELYRNPGKWHLEKLPEYGGNSSIRLDQGMRVLFNVDADGAVNILDVGKHIGH